MTSHSPDAVFYLNGGGGSESKAYPSPPSVKSSSGGGGRRSNGGRKDDTAARSIVNRKVRSAASRPPPVGIYQSEEPPLSAAEVQSMSPPPPPVRPLGGGGPPSDLLNDLVPAVVPSCFKEEEWLHDMEAQEKQEKDEAEAMGIDSEPFCYLCQFAQEPGDNEVNTYYQKIEGEWNKNYGNMKDMTLCKLLQDMYNEDCRKYVPDRPEWKTSTIYRHFTEHDVNDMTSNRWTKTQYQRMMSLVARSGLVVRETATNIRRIDFKAMKAFMDLDKRRQLLVTTSAMAGGSGGGSAASGAPLTSSRSSAKVS